MIWLWWACSDGIISDSTFGSERQLYQRNQEIAALSDTTERYNALLALHKDFPASRSILEQLVLLELDAEPKSFQRGLRRLEAYLEQHPGDATFRIHFAKFLLKTQEVDKALHELTLVLHNQTVHPWTLAQDDFFQKVEYREILRPLLPVDGLQVLSVTQPSTVFLGQTALWEIEVLHLSSCSVSMPPQHMQPHLAITQLQRTASHVDDVVQNTKIQMMWTAVSIGEHAATQLTLQCGNRTIQHPITLLRVVSEQAENHKATSVSLPLFWYPEQSDGLNSGGVLLREYVNEFRSVDTTVSLPTLDED